MHAFQDYPIFQTVDEHDKFTVCSNWINKSFLLGPVYLELIQLTKSAKIKSWPGINKLTLLFLKTMYLISLSLNEL